MICGVVFRFRVSGSIGVDDAAIVDLEGLPPIRFAKIGAAAAGGYWATMSFDIEESKADEAAELLLDRLLIAGASDYPGVDLATARPPVKLKGGELGPAYLDSFGALGTNLEAWKDQLAAGGSCLSRRQRTSALLINDARFAIQPEARLVLSVTAVEALCEQPDQRLGIVEAIEALKVVLRSRSMSEDDRLYLLGRLQGIADRVSVTKAYTQRLVAIGLGSELDYFTKKIYGPRSKLVHSGKGRGDLADTADRALAFASKAFLADVKHSQTT